jgi:DNA polymerase-3 subunit alpha
MDIDIDVSSHKRDIVFQCLSNYYESIGGKIVRVSTFGTETAKSTILTACRGLKINNDVGLYLSSLIPVERGFVWSIEDCYFGNEELGRNPIAEFKKIIDKYPGLLEIALGIQGLINKRSSHAAGVLIVNEDFTEHNAIMRTPSKEIVSQFNLEDSEYVGNVKYDILNTKTCGMIQKTLEMLVDHRKMEWQGTLRKTYDKYLHPDVIDKESSELWELLHKGELVSAFQFDSPVGAQALRLIKPTNLLEATNANNLMRLMGEEGRELPLDMYVRYKNNVNEWFNDMKNFGLNEKEINIMKRHLLEDYGVCSSQERMMLISMDEEIAGFDVVEANVLRKSVAKKIKELLEESEKKLFEKGLKNNVSEKLLKYVWDVQIAMQRGYGFSVLHGVGYTYILIQQLNLVYYYPTIYWNTAVLLVESGALEQDALDDEDSLDSLNQRKEKTTNYGTVAKAIGNMQSQGVHIALPDINRADLGFKPDELNNQIIFGLKGIMKISNETARVIIENRPYKSLNDFYKRMVLTKQTVTLSTGKKQNRSLVTDSQLITLIKAGAFDEIEGKPREEILLEFLRTTNTDKNKINSRGIEQVIEMGIVPNEFKDEIRLYRFRQYILDNEYFPDQSTKSVKWHSISNGEDNVIEYATNFFFEYFGNEMAEGQGYYYDSEGIVYIAMGTARKGSFEDIYKKKMLKFNAWLNSEDCLNKYNEILFDDVKKLHMSGNISTWEMESMNFYYHEHELLSADLERYDVQSFFDLEEEPVIVDFTYYKGLEYPKFKLSRIVGTVLDKDKNKHIVSILTPNGVVQVKLYSGQFAFYDKTISVQRDDGKGKMVLEDSWFKRGNKLLITGFRRGDQFRPKRYRDSVYPHTIQKIVDIGEDGSLILQSERRSEEE